MKRKVVRTIIAVGFLAAVIWLVRITDAREIVRGVLARIEGLGPWAPFWFILADVGQRPRQPVARAQGFQSGSMAGGGRRGLRSDPLADCAK